MTSRTQLTKVPDNTTGREKARRVQGFLPVRRSRAGVLGKVALPRWWPGN